MLLLSLTKYLLSFQPSSPPAHYLNEINDYITFCLEYVRIGPREPRFTAMCIDCTRVWFTNSIGTLLSSNLTHS